jgi:hypothetical protein
MQDPGPTIQELFAMSGRADLNAVSPINLFNCVTFSFR